jgi:uncharacterized DUF497 family protein
VIALGDWSFTWDPDKAASNLKDHKVSFPDAATAFMDPLGLFLADVAHPEREILIAESTSGRLLFTVFVEVDTTEKIIRIISARHATSHERRSYEEAAEG